MLSCTASSNIKFFLKRKRRNTVYTAVLHTEMKTHIVHEFLKNFDSVNRKHNKNIFRLWMTLTNVNASFFEEKTWWQREVLRRIIQVHIIAHQFDQVVENTSQQIFRLEHGHLSSLYNQKRDRTGTNKYALVDVIQDQLWLDICTVKRPMDCSCTKLSVFDVMTGIILVLKSGAQN